MPPQSSLPSACPSRGPVGSRGTRLRPFRRRRAKCPGAVFQASRSSDVSSEKPLAHLQSGAVPRSSRLYPFLCMPGPFGGVLLLRLWFELLGVKKTGVQFGIGFHVGVNLAEFIFPVDEELHASSHPSHAQLFVVHEPRIAD